MLNKHIERKLKGASLPVIFLSGGFLIWEAIVLIFKIPEYFLARPSEIFLEIVKNFGFLVSQLGITILEAIIGFIIANILGFFIAIIFVHSKTIERGLYPYVLGLKMTPVIAIAPFLIIWFGLGIASKIATVIIICFFPILVNAIKGLKTINNETLDLFKSLSANKWQIFLKLRLPNSIPYVFQALKTSAVLAIIGALVGEFVGSNKGIGYIILNSASLFNTTETFSAIIMVIVGGILFFEVICLVEKIFLLPNSHEEI